MGIYSHGTVYDRLCDNRVEHRATMVSTPTLPKTLESSHGCHIPPLSRRSPARNHLRPNHHFSCAGGENLRWFSHTSRVYRPVRADGQISLRSLHRHFRYIDSVENATCHSERTVHQIDNQTNLQNYMDCCVCVFWYGIPGVQSTLLLGRC